MKQEFEMQQSEMDEILRINKEVHNLPLMMMGEFSTSRQEKAEAINQYWRTLGEKYGFEWDTAEGSSKGTLFFLATPKPKVIPKTLTEIEIDKYDTLEKIVNHLEKCNYENDETTLVNNYAFLALKKMIK